MFRKLAPGPWFNSVGPDQYATLYQAEILDQLDPHQVAADLVKLAGGRAPVLLCYERPGAGAWCHRSLAASWLAEAIGQPVPEVGFEGLSQADHPLSLPRQLL